ncbi:MAG: cytidyltransferase-related domain protein [Candidatus Magasanikbacteria bacterium]|nr:cytidyltransferase-related domain protein [Candidatus Magasanikbacteria bacterium]
MKTVMVFGTFDVLHLGHIAFLKAARRHGDRLVVIVARDAAAERLKKTKLRFKEGERAQMLRELRLVDEAVSGAKANFRKAVAVYKPFVIALGYDQEAYVNELRRFLTSKGLNTKVVRLKAFKARRYKTSLFINR